MTDSIKLAEMQRTSIEYERQRHLANWFIKSSPHMATPSTPTTLTSNGPGVVATHLHVEGRKPKLRRFNSHDTSANMFSVTDFENARLARRNEIEMKQHLQRRMRNNANGTNVHNLLGGGCDFSTGDSKSSKYSNESQHEPLPADIFLNRYSLPRVVRITYKTKFSDETLQSSSSNDSSTSHSVSTHSGCGVVIGTGKSNGTDTSTGTTETGTSCSTASSTALNSPSNQLRTTSNNNNNSNNNSNSKHVINSNLNVSVTNNNHNNGGKQDETQENGELYLLYRLIRQRHIYHGYNAKTAATNRKKCVLIPQEFPGYFSLLNEKGIATATVYTSLIQLVRERVYKFVSVDNMPAFSESQANSSAANNPPTDSCLPLYTTSSNNTNRPQYVKTTARGGQVFRLLAVFEDGKQDHHALATGASNHANANNGKINGSHGREKEKGRYAQLLNENRQILYVSLSTKGKFYEIEPGIPQILQKLAGGNGLNSELNKKINADCVHRITMLVGINRELPITIRYISGPSGGNNIIPEYVTITKITTENVMIACPIEDVEAMQQPLQLRKLHLTKEMNLMKSSLGFESESRMLANPNVQNMLKFCQFNCDQFLKMLEVEQHNRSERSGSKSRVDGLRILKPLHLPKLLRREKTMSAAHEREDSIIFFSKTDLANMNANKEKSNNNTNNNSNNNVEETPTRITDKMKVFQTTKKKWFRKQDKNAGHSMTSLDLDVQSKRLSMERYSDISKLLQERFGDKSAVKSAGNQSNTMEHGGGSMSGASVTSDLGCSDTETSTLPTVEEQNHKKSPPFSPPPPPRSSERLLQKSMSLQDIELLAGRQQSKYKKPDILASHQQHRRLTDTISEAGTELEEQENCAPLPQSFITEKLYNEFHVKTRQYSKSSSSLHQLLNFSLPQKLQIHENNNNNNNNIHHSNNNKDKGKIGNGGSVALKRLDFNIGAPVAIMYNNVLSPISFIEDDLPYSSVRDSLLLPAHHEEVGVASKPPVGQTIDYTKENIYAEICHEASAMGGVPTSRTRDTNFSNETQSTHLPADDYGDYASLTYLNHQPATTIASNVVGNAVSRVQVNLPSSVSYHTVYLGDEPLGDKHQQDRSHVTTVELKGLVGASIMKPSTSSSAGAAGTAAAATGVARVRGGIEGGGLIDNIYNTLK